ncbi:hypothetical protein VCRA2121O391_120088 [Vibrio crassostreae]|nr:hypothetical protein VCRA2119O381_1080008 [Vibrio crassostreae]CAK1766424.1 hypothetical protein VCRA2113O356_140037 [Vibrio crassostreae]CAK1797675.1 hypothetical protein VCRA2114O367_160089 [Vibrio crassostreae]CAK1828449.1 hypothetical protein VCRA2119O145_10111 [Vibrio crassostreae]CAK2151591.1 hypothetical protein VCRA2117O38_40286 [Vibrio crassostreae]
MSSVSEKLIDGGEQFLIYTWRVSDESRSSWLAWYGWFCTDATYG